MKIALLGYGKMGKVIERIALERGHEIVLKKTEENSFDGLLDADVAIDFSVPSAAVQNISECLHHNIPIVSGTTGWLEHYDDMTSLCTSKNGAFIYGSNFSLGVNLFFELNAHLAKIMSRFNQYEVSMEEIHHTQKLDKPSGTAITLAQNIIKEKNLSSWSIENPNENELFIDVKRIDSVPGTHSISYTSEVDTIEITHTAHNRDGFALGAVIASEWLINKKGIYTMKDVLGL
ncbi:MAG: 4-hydroxy-tetrahydrodipicolinate reductase [Flavobacterium sp.]|nr:4-hydroxy-tetrahydrodipicolinate reductase [Flavobacterium sp.]MBP6100038.1 4-hydroxy-tetrahydrodipicolinate reductase [Flavobacterium sp.]